MTEIDAIALSEGSAAGEILALGEPLSFWGGLDSATGRIIDRWHPDHGTLVTGRVLLMPGGRGSSSGSSVLAEAIRLGTGPAGIVLPTRDAIVAVGAMVAAELYGRFCPVVLVSAAAYRQLAGARRLRLAAGADRALVTAEP